MAEVELPARAEHERERKLPQKKGDAPVRGRQTTERKTVETKVPVEKRITEFPNHSLCINKLNGMLRCAACPIDIVNKVSSIRSHIKMEIRPGEPTRHAKRLQLWNMRVQGDSELKRSLVEYFEAHPDESSGTNDPDELLYRYRVAEAFLSCPPFERIDHFRPLLQRSGHALTGAQHLKLFIPQIQKVELELLNAELLEQYIGIAFDGTTRLGEAINVTGRWCTENFEIVMRLLDFTTLKAHVNNVQLAAHITNVVMQQRRVPLTHVVNLARDSVSVNGAACRRMQTTFTSAADSLCFCHTLCHVGEHFELPTLKEFKTPWLELVGGRDPHRGAKALWKEMVQVTVPGYSKVRWYSWAEILFVIAEAGMNLLGNFISKCEERDYGDAMQTRLRNIYNQQPDALRLELAAMLDMRTLVKTTYELEGDRLEVLLVYDRIEALRALGRSIAAYQDGVLPNVDAVLRLLMKLKKGTEIEKHFNGHGICVGQLDKKEKVNSTLYPDEQHDAWLIKYADGHEEHFEEEELRSGKYGAVPAGQDGKPVLIVRNLAERKSICDALAPGFNYLEARITGQGCAAQYSLVDMYALCRAARAFDPSFAKDHVNAAFVDGMSVIVPLNALGMLPSLKQQLPQFVAAARNAPAFDKGSVADYSNAILTWWRDNGTAFPAWAVAARIIFAISPNSASCERIFALLKNLFGEEQMNALADYVMAALMLNYNGRLVG